HGEIHALFYRYDSIGGQDFVADLLIGPQAGVVTVPTRPGDSGTVWFLDVPAGDGKLNTSRDAGQRPIAWQWGGQRFMDGASEATFQFALATCLSTICRELQL